MSVVLTSNSASIDRTGPRWLVESSGYDILANLSLAPTQGRAEVQVAIPHTARSLDQMVLIKRFQPDAREPDWVQLVAELELASCLCHDNIVRTLGIGLEAGGYFSIHEFLEGATLRDCLEWSATTCTRLGNIVVAHILLAILDAVKHASLMARSGQSQALVCAPVAADDVFITYDGQVKLLGFKSTHGRGTADAAARPYAIDALLEQLPLRRVSPRRPSAASLTAREPAEEIRSALCPELGSDLGAAGRAELSSVMRQVLRTQRARQALRFAKAFAQLRGPVRRSSPLTAREESPPASGLRRVAARAPDAASQPVEPFGLVRRLPRG